MESGMMRPIAAAAALAASFAIAASAPAAPLSVRDSFRIGNSGVVYCSAQNAAVDKALVDMFDLGYSITCRDAALPVGAMYKLRDAASGAARLAAARSDKVECAEFRPGSVPGLGRVEIAECKLKDADVGYRVYQLKQGRLYYSAEGLAG